MIGKDKCTESRNYASYADQYKHCYTAQENGAQNMKRDGVSVAFEMIMEEIEAVEAQLNEEGATAFKNSQYADADRLSAAGKELKQFREKLETLRQEWSSGIDLKTRERVKVKPGYQIPPHKKGPRTNLRITLPNGRVIQRPTAAQAMADAIEAIGLDRVKSLGLTVSGVPLVGTDKHPKYGQTPVGKFLICTHSNTKSKKDILQNVVKSLGADIRVEVI